MTTLPQTPSNVKRATLTPTETQHLIPLVAGPGYACPGCGDPTCFGACNPVIEDCWQAPPRARPRASRPAIDPDARAAALTARLDTRLTDELAAVRRDVVEAGR